MGGLLVNVRAVGMIAAGRLRLAPSPDLHTSRTGEHMNPGVTSTKFGRFSIAEPPLFDRMLIYKGEGLRVADHEPPIPILDQEDLLAQGIHVSQIVPGATDVQALGSCTCNAGTASLAELYATAGKPLPAPLSTTDAAADESFAIELYHAVTDQTGNPSQEWPPSDCGSTGLYVCQELIHQKWISSYLTTNEIHALASLLQQHSVIMGSPWFNAWMEPDAGGFIDGNGGIIDFERAVRSGVAGGHETAVCALERLTLNPLGWIDADKSHVRVRNSWSASWGDHGCYRIHLSTLRMLSLQVDFKAFVL